MKKIAVLAALVVLLAGAVWVVSDTTFSWSQPGQKGTLTYTGLNLSGPSITNGSLIVTNVALASTVQITGGEAKEAVLTMSADDRDDADDIATVAMSTGGNLSFRGTSGTNEVVYIDMSSGDVVLDGDLDVNGDNINCDGDLIITATGGEVTLRTNVLVTGTLGVTNALTLHNDLNANGNVVGDGSTIVTNMAVVESDSFKVGGVVGQTVTITNIGWGSTNILVFTSGILTGSTLNP